MKNQIITSSIEHLYFTSGFGKNNAFRLFYIEVLKNPFVEDYWKERKEFPLKIDDRKTVTCHILISPSDSSNRAVGRYSDYKVNKQLYMNRMYPPTYAYKIARYQEVFNFLK
jgi:hypothetical protein